MNDLIQMIDNRINRQLRNSTALSSVPCRILEVYPDGNAKVLVINNNAEYVVPNYSGSDLLIGEEAQLFFQGDVSLGRFMYVGASVNKQSGGTFGLVVGSNMPGEVFQQERVVSRINFRCKERTPCLLFFNATVFGSTSGDLNIKIYIDDIISDFNSITTLNLNEYRTVSFSLPEIFSSGEHHVKITACGFGSFLSMSNCISGYGLTESEYSCENDYIFKINDDSVEIIYYIGNELFPEIPTKIQGKPVTKLLATAFNYSDVTNVYIPEGVEEIE
ncbi:MAG: hypothetical protein NC485_14795 [Ruminococcus flavefaciens]|nr:hypothetical protein [Ruminococcus flavefaciens]MCM1062432.1 hypothetical protein [Eubacterium sp.]